MKLSYVFGLSIFLGATVHRLECSVTINANGYSDILIAINPEVPESQELLDAILESWTNASRDLHIATDYRAYFKDITILLPKTWTNISCNPANVQKYNLAHVVVAMPSPAYGNAPYTMQYGGCGVAGKYIHLTPEYLLNESSVYNYGQRGKTIVHEWAHYRWGTFDETSNEFPFYLDLNAVYGDIPVPTVCPKSVYGEVINSETGRGCATADLDPITLLYPDKCVFIPYESDFQSFNLDSSIMGYQYMEQVSTFCRNESGINQHNKDAPNDQNRFCDFKSTWEVIMESEDFQNNNNLPNPQVDTTPTFNIVGVKSQRFVLVLDISGSMQGTGLQNMRMAANYFIATVANGSLVGMVEFETDARRLADLVKIETQADREYLANLIPTYANGGTSIGDGIYEGVEVLSDYGDPSGGYLLVMTDGLQNQPRTIEDVWSNVIDNNVVVETIFMNTNENDNLMNLSVESGGDWYFTDDALELMNAFNEISQVDDGDVMDMNFQIQSVSFTLNYGENYLSSVVIDATVGLNTVFTFTWSQYAFPPDIVITSPSKCSYLNFVGGYYPCTAGSSSHQTITDFMTVRFIIPGKAETGEWTYIVTPSTNYEQDINVIITSMAADKDVEPIIVTSGMSSTDVSGSNPAVVYAQVTQGYNPVLNATVFAIIDRPSGGPETIQLLDNGAGSDIRINDGVYSRYFTDFTGQGRYSVRVEVSHTNSTAVTRISPGSRANYRGGVIKSDGTFESNPNGVKDTQATATGSAGVESADIGEFSRVVTSGGFSYTPPPPGTATDVFPPNKIIDMRSQQNDLEDFNKGVVLMFTAPGNDYDTGTASRYDIRYTFDDPTSLVTDFDLKINITDSDVINGSLNNPLPAGNLETIIVRTPGLPANNDSIRLSFGLRAYDEYGNVGDPSNVATMSFFITPVVLAVTTDAPTTAEATTTSTTDAPTTAVTTKPVVCEYCPDCEKCDPNTDLYMILMATFGALTLAFLACVILLSIWLSKVNKQHKNMTRQALKGRDNPNDLQLDDWEESTSVSRKPRTGQNRVVPVLSLSTKDGKPVIAYVPKDQKSSTSMLPRANSNNPYSLEF